MIPNFLKVEERIYRGGQPETPADWQSLVDLGITQVIKLNPDSEAVDEVPSGMLLMKCPITDEQQILTEPDLQSIRTAVAFIAPGTYVHCKHGQDRSGVVIALFRLSRGWTYADARNEMLDLGFHKILLGLDKAWWDLSPEFLQPAA